MSRLVILRKEELPFGKRVLTVGCEGRDVEYLQHVLNKLGIYNGDFSGHYDLLTMEAVKTFQKAYYLPVDGITGPDTCKLLVDPSIHNRLLVRLSDGEMPELPVAEYGVSPQALKHPADRRRLRNPETRCSVMMIEQREIILGVRQEREEKTPGKGQTIADTGLPVLHLLKLEELATAKAKKNQLTTPERLVLSVTGKRALRMLRKISIKLRTKQENELLWWLTGDHLLFPHPREADGLIYTPRQQENAAQAHAGWGNEVRKILSSYPCTRMIIHFDLRGRGKTVEGEGRFLTVEESRIARLNGISSPKRMKENGWVYHRYRFKGEEREAYLPDRRTIRGILQQIDYFNLRGVLFTGVEEWETVIKEESNRFFQASQRILVMNSQALA